MYSNRVLLRHNWVVQSLHLQWKAKGTLANSPSEGYKRKKRNSLTDTGSGVLWEFHLNPEWSWESLPTYTVKSRLQEAAIVHGPAAGGGSFSGHHRIQETDSQTRSICLSVYWVPIAALAALCRCSVCLCLSASVDPCWIAPRYPVSPTSASR